MTVQFEFDFGGHIGLRLILDWGFELSPFKTVHHHQGGGGKYVFGRKTETIETSENIMINLSKGRIVVLCAVLLSKTSLIV